MARNTMLNDPDFDPLADEFDDDVEAGGRPKKIRDDEFSKMLHEEGAKSFKKMSVGDSLNAKIVAIGESSVFVDVGQRSEGAVDLVEFTPEERQELKPGMMLRLYVASLGAGGIELTKSLSARQLSRDTIEQAMASGLPVEGKVTGENKGGYTVEVAGIRGFVPFSQMDIGPRQLAAAYIGKQFTFRIMQVSGRDIVLSRAALLREEQEGEQIKLLEALDVGQTRDGKVVKVEKFGVFIDLGAGLTALVPGSELSWSRTAGNASALIGDTLTVKIIKIERGAGRPRIAASIKQLEGDPWERAADKLAVNSTVQGTVTRLMTFGAFVEILPGVEGLLHISEMSAKRRIAMPGEVVKPDQQVTVRITAIDRLAKRISLSMKVLEDEYLDGATRAKYLKNKEEEAEKADRGVELIAKGGASTFGDAFVKAQERAKGRKG